MVENNSSLDVILTKPSAEGTWITLEQMPYGTDQADQNEISDLIDTLYNTDICDTSYELPVCGGTMPIGRSAPEITEEDVIEAAAAILEIPACTEALNYYTTTIRVIRDISSLPYVLKLDRGEVLKTVTKQEVLEQRILIEELESITLKYPVMSDVVMQWEGASICTDGDCDSSLSYAQGEITWGGTYTGVLVVSYLTRWDEVEVSVPKLEDAGTSTESTKWVGNDGKYLLDFYTTDTTSISNDDRVLAFYDKSVTAENIQEPTIENGYSSSTLCSGYTNDSGSTSSGGVIHKNKRCENIEERTTKCQCTGETKDTVEIPTEVACDKYEQAGYHVYSFTKTVEYVDCGGDDSSVTDPEFYEKKCCIAPEIPLPLCKESIAINKGGHSLEAEKAEALIKKYQAKYGENVAISFIPVAPEDGDCGLITTKQEVSSLNCCEGATQLVVDTESSVEVIADNSEGIVYVTGGKDLLTVEVRGQGFWIKVEDGKAKEAITGKSFIVVTEDACGQGQISITDGCSSTSHSLSSTEGSWTTVEGRGEVEGLGPLIKGMSNLPYDSEGGNPTFGFLRRVGTDAGKRIVQDYQRDDYYWHYTCAPYGSNPESECSSGCESFYDCIKIADGGTIGQPPFPCFEGGQTEPCPEGQTGYRRWELTSYSIQLWQC